MKKLILIIAAIALSSCGSDVANNTMVVPPGCLVYKPSGKTYYSGICLGGVVVYVWKQADGTWLMGSYYEKKLKFFYKDEQGKWIQFDDKMPNPEFPPDLMQSDLQQ